jgi:anthranilate synthase component I
VSGAPKIKAIELVFGLEQERRGVYAGAVGRFDFAEDEMDTCIAIRTMTFKDGVAYLQAGGGIVFDSVEEEEYVETLNKLQGNIRALEAAERECPNYLSYPAIDLLSRIPSRPSAGCHQERALITVP